MCCGDWAVAPHGEGVRRLLFVLAVDREAAGRERAARVVHLTLPETARTGWRAPQGRREVLRSLASTIAATREGNPAPDFQPTDTLPEQLFIPSQRSEEHTSELQSLMRNSYAVFCLTQNTTT